MMNQEDVKQKYLKKLHTEILNIMDEVDRICQEYNLCYYLMAGSCLGAVRHKGFIPWDDDLDVAMPRKDFDKFIALITGQSKDNPVLNGRFYLRWITTEKYYNQDFAKVCLRGTVFQDSNGKASLNSGIFVDVFPLDSCGPYSYLLEGRSRIYNHLHSCLFLKGAEKFYMDWKIKHWLRNFITILFSNRSIYRMMLWTIKSKENNKSECQAFFSTPYPIKRQVFPRVWHGEGKRMPFEDRYYMCPYMANQIMQFMYGDDYMVLPPENKRKSHCPIRVVFSDGEEMRLDEPQVTVEYKDVLC